VWLLPFHERGEDEVRDERSEGTSSGYDSASSGMGTMAWFVQMWIALDQSRPEMQPPLMEMTFFV
jgi:hypothetical protein